MGRFRDALAGSRLAAIAEIKRRSPSAGDLRPDADPALLAPQLTRAGAAALSVLVDERFGGSLDDLRAARAATALPILGKGFFTEEIDLLKLKMAGADAVLILLRDVDDERARALLAYARELGLDALVEAHDADELGRAVALRADPIGVNARDLSTFRLDRRAQLELLQIIGYLKVFVANRRFGDLARFIRDYRHEGWAVVRKLIFRRRPPPVAAPEPPRRSPYFEGLSPPRAVHPPRRRSLPLAPDHGAGATDPSAATS